MNTSFSMLLLLRKSKNSSDLNQNLYCRLTYKSQRIEISLGLKWDPSRWNKESERAIGSREDARQLNDSIDLLKNKIYTLKLKQEQKDEELNLLELKNQLLNKTIESKRTILQLLDNKIKQITKFVGIDFSANTVKGYKTTNKHLKEFLNNHLGKEDLQIEKVDHAFIMGFEYFLKSDKNCQNNTALRYIRIFKIIINECLSNEWIHKDPFRNYKTKLKYKERECLSSSELERLENKKILNSRLTIVKDIFVFSCYTGLAYIDIFELKNEHISIGVDGNKWIHKKRHKTPIKAHIPILPIALSLIDKYSDYPKSSNLNKVFPVLSNQKMNAYLKEIADICGIEKELTFHMARHTFATTVTLNPNYAIEISWNN